MPSKLAVAVAVSPATTKVADFAPVELGSKTIATAQLEATGSTLMHVLPLMTNSPVLLPERATLKVPMVALPTLVTVNA